MLLLLLLLGCAPEADTAPPPDPGPVVERMGATLDEAVRLDAAGQHDEARDAWRRAHVLYERDLAPRIAREQGDRAATRADYRFALVRAALDARDGAPEEQVRALVSEVDALIAAPPTVLSD